MTCSPVAYINPLYIFCLQSITFFIIVGIISYFLYTKGLFYIHSARQKDEDYAKKLEEERELLAQNQHLIDEKIIEQQLLFEQLQQSLLSWKTALQKKADLAQERQAKIAHNMASYMQARHEKLAAIALQEQTIPQACKQAAQILQEKFLSPHQGHLFLSALCHHLEREKL